MARRSTTRTVTPTSPALRRVIVPVEPPTDLEPITINTHRQLATRSKAIAKRVADSPEFSVMFLANPVLALESYGVKLSPEMRRHVLETLRHPPRLRARREELEKKLAEKLDGPVKPTDPEWMAELVFTVRKIKPRTIGNRTPAYKPPLNADAIKRLQAARPEGTKRYPGKRRLPVRFSLKVAPPKDTIRRMDLDAELPELKPAARPTKTLTLEKAWFYKDDPVVRDAVELGQIMRRGFPFATPAQFREIAAGKKVDAFRNFVRGVTLKEVKRE